MVLQRKIWWLSTFNSICGCLEIAWSDQSRCISCTKPLCKGWGWSMLAFPSLGMNNWPTILRLLWIIWYATIFTFWLSSRSLFAAGRWIARSWQMARSTILRFKKNQNTCILGHFWLDNVTYDSVVAITENNLAIISIARTTAAPQSQTWLISFVNYLSLLFWYYINLIIYSTTL